MDQEKEPAQVLSLYAYIGKLNDANAIAIVTKEGVVVVDTGNNTTDTREILRNIQSVTTAPVRYVVITQNHTDHSGGAPLFSPPATVIVYERVVQPWAAMKPYQVTSWRKRFSERIEALKSVNPIDTVMSFNDRLTLHLGGKEIHRCSPHSRHATLVSRTLALPSSTTRTW